MKGLVLPSNGEMMLPLTGSLLIAGDSRVKDKCPGEGRRLHTVETVVFMATAV
jgi:hypothetical protein